MIKNRFEDAVAQKCRMTFYLEPRHKIRVERDNLYCFCPVTKSNVKFVGNLSVEDIAILCTNVIR